MACLLRNCGAAVCNEVYCSGPSASFVCTTRARSLPHSVSLSLSLSLWPSLPLTPSLSPFLSGMGGADGWRRGAAGGQEERTAAVGQGRILRGLEGAYSTHQSHTPHAHTHSHTPHAHAQTPVSPRSNANTHIHVKRILKPLRVDR